MRSVSAPIDDGHLRAFRQETYSSVREELSLLRERARSSSDSASPGLPAVARISQPAASANCTAANPTPPEAHHRHRVDHSLMPSGKGIPKSETLCHVAVQFLPTEATSYSGTLTIFDNLKPSEMQTVQMTGKGKSAK